MRGSTRVSRRKPDRRVAGFTLIEALATLAVTGLTLGVIFMVGMRGVGTGFRLGQRAVDHANQQVSTQAVKDVLDSMILPSLTIPSQAAETEAEADDQNGMGDEFDGSAASVAGYIVALRDNPCLPVGGEGRITLSFRTNGGRTDVLCQLNSDDPVVVADLDWPNAQLSYSEDGTTWSDTWQVVRGQEVDTQINPDAEQREVYVRMATADGAHQVIGLIQSGRNIPLTGTAYK